MQKLLSEYLRVENVLQNYDEFAGLKALQSVDMDDAEAVEAFKAKYYVDDGAIATMQAIDVPAERLIQDHRSTYSILATGCANKKGKDKKRVRHRLG